MKFRRYLKEHSAWIWGCFFLILTMDIFLLTVRGSVYLIMYMTFATLGCFLIGFILDYRKMKKIFDEIDFRMNQLDKKYMVPEVVSDKGSQERELILEILKDAELSMGDNVAKYKREMEEYKDYIETWVHEVKAPIATSKMMVENYKDRPLKESGIDSEIDRIEGYVEQALFYSRSSAVENDYFIKVIDIGKVVRGEVSKRKKSFISLKATVEIEVERPRVISSEVTVKEVRKIRSDEKWIGFVIGQILDNSIKYAKKDEALRLSIFITEEDGKSCLNIKDNGVGMKASEVGRAFDKGFTGTNGRAGKASTGIGLYLCKKLCNRLEHDIRMESEEGKGSTVVITFN